MGGSEKGCAVVVVAAVLRVAVESVGRREVRYCTRGEAAAAVSL